MKKCAKVICVWFGDKRPGNSNINTIEIIDDMIDNEMTIDTGYPTDTIWVINKCENELWDNYLDRYNGKSTLNGKMIVEKRKNSALAFGAYLHAYKKYKKDYDYFWFCEDDVFLYRDNYVKEYVDYIEDHPFISFLGIAPIVGEAQPHIVSNKRMKSLRHCGGGCGLTKTKYINETYPNPDEDLKIWHEEWEHARQLATEGQKQPGGDQNYLHNHEVEFTARFNHSGKLIQNHPKFSVLGLDYQKHSSTNSRAHFLSETEKEKIKHYYVGKNNYKLLKQQREDDRNEEL